MAYYFLGIIAVEVFTSCIDGYLLQEFAVEFGNHHLAIAVALIRLCASVFDRDRSAFFGANTYGVDMYSFFLCFGSDFGSTHFVVFAISEDKDQARSGSILIEIVACHTYCFLNGSSLRGKHIGVHTL